MFREDSLTGAILGYLIHTLRALTEGSLTVFSQSRVCVHALSRVWVAVLINSHRVSENYPILFVWGGQWE